MPNLPNLRALFSHTKPDAARGMHFYVSAKGIIAAAVHQNLAGIYYEQAAPITLEGMPTAMQLGDAFRTAFDRFSIRDTDLRNVKKSDWPAFEASGLRSIKEFERAYRLIGCYGLNGSNAVVRAAIAHPVESGVELSVCFNPLLPPAAIGEQLMRLAEVANAI